MNSCIGHGTLSTKPTEAIPKNKNSTSKESAPGAPGSLAFGYAEPGARGEEIVRQPRIILPTPCLCRRTADLRGSLRNLRHTCHFIHFHEHHS
jgi:hypothetical protein